MEELIRSFKIERNEMDPDLYADYAFILGDLNYRMKTTYTEMVIETEKLKMAPQLIEELDQLAESRRGSQFRQELPNGRTLYEYYNPRYPEY